MKNLNDFKSDLYNMIEKAIMDGVSGSTIADTLVSNIHISRENALTMVVSVGTQLLANNEYGLKVGDKVKIIVIKED